MTSLLERDAALAALSAAVASAEQRRGCIALVTGEAGIGKSSLIHTWLESQGTDARVLVGWCDDFLTSRPFGPLHDVGRTVGGELAEVLRSGDVGGVLDAVLTELAYPLAPTIIVLEDMHWADEATLDVVRYVGRRIEPLPAVLVLTYRDDEVGPDHPLTGVLGALPNTSVHRVVLPPLSRRAIAALTVDRGLEPDEVLRATGGNPFFVTELVAGGGAIPASVGDAVMARIRKLPRAAQQAVEALAVVPGLIPTDLLAVLVPDLDAVTVVERRGMLVTENGGVRFRHELARDAVLATTPDTAQIAYHGRVLDHLLTADAEAALLLHHAAGAHRADVIARYGPVAATQAFNVGAHREAAAHHRRVLAHPELLAPDDLARLLEEHAWALLNLLRITEAVGVAERAVQLRSELDDRAAHVRALLTFARVLYLTGEPDEAQRRIAEAQAMLGAVGQDDVEAEVRTHRLALAHLTDEHEVVLEDWHATVALARRIGRTDLRIYGDVYGGTSTVMRGDARGLEAIEAAIEAGWSEGWLEALARAYTNLVLSLVLLRRWDEALARIDEAIRFYDDHQFRGHRYDTVAQWAQLLVHRGEWAEATRLLGELDRSANEAGALRSLTLAAEALLAVRTGAPDAADVLTRAWSETRDGRSESMVPTACAGIEWAWLTGRPQAADPFVEVALPKVAGTLWLEHLRWRLPLVGRAHDADDVRGEPERTSLTGDHRGAAAAWSALGMPFEAAVELLHLDEPEPALEALLAFERLGAQPAARLARQRLRDLGVRNIPRGPTSATRDHPLGLTPRQVEVLELLAEGLTNAEIADRLVVSIRTVDHHVSTVLQKLGVSSRKEAAERAAAIASSEPARYQPSVRSEGSMS